MYFTRAALYLVAAVAAAQASPEQAAAQEAFCADPNAICGKLVSPACLSSFGAGAIDAPSDASCATQFDSYRQCLATAVQCERTAGRASTPPSACDAALDRELWSLAEAEGDCGGYQAFLEACPGSRRTAFAENRRARLKCDARPASTGVATDLQLDALCVRGGSDPAPAACGDHVFARIDGIWRAFGRTVEGRWGVDPECKISMSLAMMDTRLEMRTPDGSAQGFDLVSQLKGESAAGDSFNTDELISLSPVALRFDTVRGTGLLSRTGFRNALKGQPPQVLEIDGDRMLFQASGTTLRLTRC
ncbi:MAG: hypothetical protein AAF909_07490 [Pseudomonadota bacterium]